MARYSEYIEDLRDLGYKVIGEGASSIVFDHPADAGTVVKVVKNDYAYRAFVQFCQKNRGNKWLPKIIQVKSVVFDDAPEGFVVFLEKLHRVSAEPVYSFREHLKTTYKLKSAKDAEWFVRSSWGTLSREAPNELAIVARFLTANHKLLDLYWQNFMRRGTQLVFNDPVA